jgi:Asp-tRNA(Asn)/Glu-tRNA(Gln) amidotransferase B subunit
LRAEVSTLKGVIEEGDRSREVLVRELSRQKEQEQDKLREAEQKREGQIKLQERMTMNLQRDKKELEARIEELVRKMDATAAKYREQHHNTVKYFEGQVAQLQVQLGRF